MLPSRPVARSVSLVLLAFAAPGCLHASAAELAPPSIVRYVAVDNVCAWPNLTLLGDGRIVTVHYSQRVLNRDRYHMGVTIWELPPP